MKTIENIVPYHNELPSDFADRLGVLYASSESKSHKKENGQFFTPVLVSRFMSKLAEIKTGKISILDPGCGVGILSCSLIERLAEKHVNPLTIDLTAYETDIKLLPFAESCFNYLKSWLKNRQINFEYKIIVEDFIIKNAAILNNTTSLQLFDQPQLNKFDYVISNPPYFKLSIEDKRTKVCSEIVSGQPNIYAFFMAISAKLLNDNGQLIFITPRSFASGNYFKAFRKMFFANLLIMHIHLFTSRRETFNRDSVLQETLIISGKCQSLNGKVPEIKVSSSNGILDIDKPDVKFYKYENIIDIRSKEKILHIPVNDYEESVFNLFQSWKYKLNDHKIQISTGPVVAFRSLKYIHEIYENSTVFLAPLFWLHNVLKMQIDWPIYKKEKGQYIQILPESQSLLIPNKNYILLRRFSAKDDKSRLVAAPYFVNPSSPDFIGIENKVNYIYRPKGDLDRNEVVGLATLLNSKIFDTYFRIFNGNVNVSSTELREMPLPSLEIIKEIGNEMIISGNFSQFKVDDIVSHYFKLSKIELV